MLTFDGGILDLFSAVGAVFHGEWSSYCRMLGCYIHLSYINSMKSSARISQRLESSARGATLGLGSARGIGYAR